MSLTSVEGTNVENVKVIRKDESKDFYNLNTESMLDNYHRSNESFNFLPSLKKSNSRNTFLGGDKKASHLSKTSVTRHERSTLSEYPPTDHSPYLKKLYSKPSEEALLVKPEVLMPNLLTDVRRDIGTDVASYGDSSSLTTAELTKKSPFTNF